MRRVSDRQDSSPPLSTSSLYLKPHHLPDRDSGYTEPDSDLDSSSHYHQQPSSARGIYPFSDDEDSTFKHHNHRQQPTWSSSTINKPFPPSSTSSLSFHNNTPSSLVDASSYHTFQADQAIEAVRQHAHEKDWKKVLKHKSGVVVYMVQKQVNGEKMAVFKGESVIQGFTPQSVFYVIGMRKLWDDQFEDGNLVQNLNETTSITYEAYRASGSSRAYDMTLVEKIDCSNDGVIVFACTSVTTSQVAKVPGRTRNEVKLHGWILRLLPTTPPSTHVTFITEEFVRGWIPGLTKKSLARKPLVIASIDSYLERKAQTPATTIDTTTQQEQQPPPPSKPTNKLLSPLSAYTRRRPSIMEQQSSPSSSPTINKVSILTNPPPRRSSLNPQQPTSRSSSLNKRITFADDVIVPPSPILETPVKDQLPLPSQQLPASSYLQAPPFDSLPSNEKLYPSSRHRSARKQSLATYKHLYSSDLEEWKALGDREGVKMYSKASPGSTLPILRGDCIIKGTWTPEQVCSVVQSFGARAKWDDSFESGRIVERFSQKEYLVYLQMRSIFPINSRDYALLTQIDSDARSETIHVVSTSVIDHLLPEIDAHTRGRMLIHGWTFQAVRNDKKERTGVKITFIAHMDLAGATPLPSAIIRLLTSDVPLCVLRVHDYITNAGCPPYIRRVAGKVINEQYDPETHHYSLSYIAKHLPSRHHHNEHTWCTDIRLHPSVYQDSFEATTKQADVSVVTLPGGVRVYTKTPSLDGTLVEIDITPASATEHSSPRPAPLDECTTAARSVHPLMQGNDQIPDGDACVNNHGTSPYLQNRQRSNSIVVIGDQLSFNGPQLSVILFLMALSYYVGKFSCRC